MNRTHSRAAMPLIVAVLMSFISIMTISANAATLPTALVNGNFEYPGYQVLHDTMSEPNSDRADWYIDVNQGKELNTYRTENVLASNWLPIPNWNKSTFGWVSTQQPAGWDNNNPQIIVPAQTVQINVDDKTHNSFAELCIHSRSAIYQDLATSPGSVYTWSLKHAAFARRTDSMSVMIGAPDKQEAQNATRTSVNGNGDKKGFVGKIISTIGGKDDFHDLTDQWETYTGSYKIPDGQTTTRFTFAVASADTPNNGNNLDDIVFDVAYPVTFNDNGGSGGPESSYQDSNGVYQHYYHENESINASPNPARSGYTFLGWSEEKLNDVTLTSYYNTISSKIQQPSKLKMTKGGKTYYAVWGKKPTVTFNKNCSSDISIAVPSSQTVDFGSPASRPSTWINGSRNIRTGYSFTGWKTTSAATVDYAFGNVYQDETVYAGWNANSYTIKFNGNGATSGSTASMSMKYDETRNLTRNGFAFTGKTFLGWNTQADGGGKAYVDEQAVKNLTVTNGETVTLYAQWSTNAYNVTFIDGHTGTTITTQKVSYGGNATPPDIPNHTGYTSIGWDKTPNNVTSNMTVTVNYRANKYIIKFDKNDSNATGTMSDMQMEYDKAQNLTANAFKLTGRTWTGWNTAANGSGKAYVDKQSVKNLTTVDGGTVTLYAQWSTNAYTVTFVDGHDNHVIKQESVKYGGAATAPDAPYHKGYTDSGWDKRFDNITTSITVTLNYVPNSYVIQFDRNGGTSGTMQPMDMKYDKAKNLTANAFGKTGYTWTGWNTQADGNGTAYQDKQQVINLVSDDNGSITLYAQWTPNAYKIQFDKNRSDATGTTASMSMKFDETKNLTENGFSSVSAKFGGWNTKSDGTGKTYSNKQEVKNLTNAPNDIVTLYAQWSINSYTVKFVDGHDGSVISSQNVNYGGSATLPTKPIHKGYTATTWSGNYQNVTKNETVTINYRPNNYEIAFDANSGTGTMPNEKMQYDTAKALDRNTFTKSGYTFIGWKDKKDETKAYTDGQKVNNLIDTDGGTVTLLAQWKANGYVIKYDSNGGTGTMADQKMEYDKADKLSANVFTRTGYTFAGWKRDDKANGKAYKNRETVINLLSESGTSTTMYAQWKANSYTVTFIDGHNGKTITTKTVTYGSSVDEPDKPTHDGYTVTGWDGSFDNITDDKTITLNYRPNKYTIKFNGNADNVNGTTADKSMEYDKKDSLTPNGYSRTGYTWTGWCDTQDGNGNQYSDKQQVTNLTSDDNGIITLYAQWKINRYTVTFIDGKTSDVISRQQVDYGSNANIPTAPTHTGYKPNGWSSDGTNIEHDTTITVSYAPISYTIAFDKNSDEATGTMSDMQMEYDKSANLTKNAFARAGYTFIGWNTDTNANGTQYTDGQSVINLTATDGAKVTLYAQWIENTHVGITYKIETDDNEADSGNTISNALDDLNPDTGIAKGSTAKAADAYTFDGWYDENGKKVSEDEKFIPTKPDTGRWVSTVYTAKFVRKEFKVRFIDKDGKTIKEETVKYGSGATAPDAPKIDGYEFTGWDKDFSNITSDLDVTALYKELPKPETPKEEPQQPTPVAEVMNDLVQTGIANAPYIIIAAIAITGIAAIIIKKSKRK